MQKVHVSASGGVNFTLIKPDSSYAYQTLITMFEKLLENLERRPLAVLAEMIEP